MLALILALLLLAPPPISITTRDHFQFAPGNVRVRVEIEPHADNRQWCLIYDGGMYSSSCYQIDSGLDAPRVYQRVLKDLPAGEYVAVAVVVRKGGEQRMAQVEFEVLETVPRER